MSEGNKDFILLGIKYESARIAGVGEAALENITGQVREEVGEDWESSPMVERGRNAVREEHGLPPLGETSRPAVEPRPPVRPWYRKILPGQR